jgi:hypothetical protein
MALHSGRHMSRAEMADDWKEFEEPGVEIVSKRLSAVFGTRTSRGQRVNGSVKHPWPERRMIEPGLQMMLLRRRMSGAHEQYHRDACVNRSGDRDCNFDH